MCKLASEPGLANIPSVIEPLALVCYEHLMPGSQLVNRLQDMGYRVQTVADTGALVTAAVNAGALVAFVDLATSHADFGELMAQLRRDPATEHLPVIAFSDEQETALQTAAGEAGATLVVSSTALLQHLRPLLDRALAVD
jgi:CheY-like chemotaxis protein